MSATQIPNLNTLRRGGGRGRGRGRGGSGDTKATAGVSQADKDKIIQSTDLDASTSRLSAVEAGYLDDPYAKFMVPGGHAAKRLPLMNRGTWARTTAIDRLVDEFISSRTTAPANSRRQIVSLGAGSDTRFLRLKQKYGDIPNHDLLYHEIDFPENTRAKVQLLEQSSLTSLLASLSGVKFLFQQTDPSCTTVMSTGAVGYFLHSHDLRELPLKSEALRFIDKDVPTLLISECCLIYLAPVEADAVLEYFREIFPSTTSLGAVIYEPLRPHDAFGRTMVANLTARGIHLQTLEANATLAMQKQRLRRVGFGPPAHDAEQKARDESEVLDSVTGAVGSVDLDFMWSSWVDDKEKERVTEAEWMDEVEEWILLMKHYCVAWGWREGSELQGRGAGRVFEGWRGVKSQTSQE